MLVSVIDSPRTGSSPRCAHRMILGSIVRSRSGRMSRLSITRRRTLPDRRRSGANRQTVDLVPVRRCPVLGDHAIPQLGNPEHLVFLNHERGSSSSHWLAAGPHSDWDALLETSVLGAVALTVPALATDVAELSAAEASIEQVSIFPDIHT